MTAKLYEHNGKKLSLTQWSKETGLDKKCIEYRLDAGWNIERALTTPSDSVANREMGDGRKIKNGALASFMRIWEKKGQAEFEKQLEDSFEKDALKTLMAFVPLLPKNEPEERTQRGLTAVQVNAYIDPKNFNRYEAIEGD